MVKTKKNMVLTILLVVSVLALCCACCFINSNTANADTEDSTESAQPRGIYTRMTIDLGTYGHSMWARARNDFTIGNSVIQVYVYLYSSPNYQYTYRNMTLEAVDYISDLDIYKTFEVTAPINGVERYWRARMQYKFDNKEWESVETKTYLISADGMLL